MKIKVDSGFNNVTVTFTSIDELRVAWAIFNRSLFDIREGGKSIEHGDILKGISDNLIDDITTDVWNVCDRELSKYL